MGEKRDQKEKTTKARNPRHLLLADDGSKPATRARTLALTLATATGARLTIVYVRDPGETEAAAMKKLAPALATAAAAGVKCNAVIQPPVGLTSPGRRIVATATAQRADMIVVGARGSGSIRKLLGSVSNYVVTNATVSVVVVR